MPGKEPQGTVDPLNLTFKEVCENLCSCADGDLLGKYVKRISSTIGDRYVTNDGEVPLLTILEGLKQADPEVEVFVQSPDRETGQCVWPKVQKIIMERWAFSQEKALCLAQAAIFLGHGKYNVLGPEEEKRSAFYREALKGGGLRNRAG